MADERIYPPMHPGRVLELEFLEPHELTPYKLAKDIGVPAPRVYDIVRGKRGISADTALRLARYFGTSPQFWLNLQAHYDLEIESDRLGDSVEREVRPFELPSLELPSFELPNIQKMLDGVQSFDVTSAFADVQQSLSAARQSLNAIEHLKLTIEAQPPLSSNYDWKQVIEQVSAHKQLDIATEAFRRAADVTARMNYNISDYASGSLAQTAKTFSLLSTSEALTGALYQTTQNMSDILANIDVAQHLAGTDRIQDPFASTGLGSALNSVTETLVGNFRPEALDSAWYLATEDVLRGGWLNLISEDNVQTAIAALQEDYSEAFIRVADLAFDPQVREMVTRVDPQDLIARAAEILYQDEITPEQAEEVVQLGIDSEALVSLSPQTLRNLGKFLIYLTFALLMAQSSPEFASYTKPLRDAIPLVGLLYALLVTRKQLEKDMREEG